MDLDLDPDPAIFVSDLQDVKNKFLQVFMLDKNSFSKSHKTVGINVFLTIFAYILP